MTTETISNHPRYDAAMNLAGRVGTNFKTLRDNKRELARELVAASVVDNFALSDAITAAKGKAGWNKLEKPEQNQLNVLFTAVRVIDGAWKALDEDVRKAFLAGEKVFSTLASEIKDAEKAALAAKDEADAKADAEAGNAPSMTPDGGAMDGVESAPSMAGQMQSVLDYVRSGASFTDDEAAILAELLSELSALTDAPEAATGTNG